MHLPQLRIFLLALFLLFVTAGLEKPAQAQITNPASCPAVLPPGTSGTPYSYTFTGAGTPHPSSPWTVSSGALPPGLLLGATGILSGTPTAAGSYSFTITYRTVSPGATYNCACTLVIASAQGCSFTGSSSGSISFGNIDPSTQGPITNNTVTQQVIFRCSTDVTYSFATNPANPRLTLSGNDIPFTLGLAALAQNNTNTTPISLFTTSSSISQANHQNAPAGQYASGIIGVTISWTGASTGSIIANVTASGTVINTCAVTQQAGTLNFNMDPSSAGTTLGVIASDLKIKCTKDSPIGISASSVCGIPPRLYPSSSGCSGFSIPYTFNISAGVTGQGFGPGRDIPLLVGGSANSANYADAPWGNYGDSQTVTISY